MTTTTIIWIFSVIAITMLVKYLYSHSYFNQNVKKIVVLMVKEDDPLYRHGVRAEKYAYQKWKDISAISFPHGCVSFKECNRTELVDVVDKCYRSGARWFCGALTSHSSMTLKPFMDKHTNCILSTTFSTVTSVRMVDNIFRMTNNISDTKEYRKWLIDYMRKLYNPRNTMLFTQSGDIWSSELGQEFASSSDYASTITADGVFSHKDLDKIKNTHKSLFICLTINWKKVLDQLHDSKIQGHVIYMANTIAYRNDMSAKHLWVLKNNHVFGSTPYPLTAGITYIARKFGSTTIPPNISSLYWTFVDAMRWIASDIDSPYKFLKTMGGKNGLYYYDKYGDQADIRTVLLKASVDDGKLDWKTLVVTGYRQTFGHFFADYTVKRNLRLRE